MSVMKAALEWSARMGWPVFPTSNKIPVVPSGVSWKDYASADAERISGMDWSAADGYGVALPPDWLVIDLDADEGSDCPTQRAWNTLRRHLPWAAHCVTEGCAFMVRTRGGGMHLYFRHDHTLPLRQTSYKPNVDLRVGGKGYVIGPGSPGYEVECWGGLDVRHASTRFVAPPKNLVPFLSAQ